MSEPNTIQDTLQDYLKQFETAATDLFETLTDAFVGKADTLRDGTELDAVGLPRDLYARPDALRSPSLADRYAARGTLARA